MDEKKSNPKRRGRPTGTDATAVGSPVPRTSVKGSNVVSPKNGASSAGTPTPVDIYQRLNSYRMVCLFHLRYHQKECLAKGFTDIDPRTQLDSCGRLIARSKATNNSQPFCFVSAQPLHDWKEVQTQLVMLHTYGVIVTEIALSSTTPSTTGDRFSLVTLLLPTEQAHAIKYMLDVSQQYITYWNEYSADIYDPKVMKATPSVVIGIDPDGKRVVRQLPDQAAWFALETRLVTAGGDAKTLWDSLSTTCVFLHVLDRQKNRRTTMIDDILLRVGDVIKCNQPDLLPSKTKGSKFYLPAVHALHRESKMERPPSKQWMCFKSDNPVSGTAVESVSTTLVPVITPTSDPVVAPKRTVGIFMKKAAARPRAAAGPSPIEAASVPAAIDVKRPSPATTIASSLSVVDPTATLDISRGAQTGELASSTDSLANAQPPAVLLPSGATTNNPPALASISEEHDEGVTRGTTNARAQAVASDNRQIVGDGDDVSDDDDRDNSDEDPQLAQDEKTARHPTPITPNINASLAVPSTTANVPSTAANAPSTTANAPTAAAIVNDGEFDDAEDDEDDMGEGEDDEDGDDRNEESQPAVTDPRSHSVGTVNSLPVQLSTMAVLSEKENLAVLSLPLALPPLPPLPPLPMYLLIASSASASIPPNVHASSSNSVPETQTASSDRLVDEERPTNAQNTTVSIGAPLQTPSDMSQCDVEETIDKLTLDIFAQAATQQGIGSLSAPNERYSASDRVPKQMRLRSRKSGDRTHKTRRSRSFRAHYHLTRPSRARRDKGTPRQPTVAVEEVKGSGVKLSDQIHDIAAPLKTDTSAMTTMDAITDLRAHLIGNTTGSVSVQHATDPHLHDAPTAAASNAESPPVSGLDAAALTSIQQEPVVPSANDFVIDDSNVVPGIDTIDVMPTEVDATEAPAVATVPATITIVSAADDTKQQTRRRSPLRVSTTTDSFSKAIVSHLSLVPDVDALNREMETVLNSSTPIDDLFAEFD